MPVTSQLPEKKLVPAAETKIQSLHPLQLHSLVEQDQHFAS